jgi:hypothetical protein
MVCKLVRAISLTVISLISCGTEIWAAKPSYTILAIQDQHRGHPADFRIPTPFYNKSYKIFNINSLMRDAESRAVLYNFICLPRSRSLVFYEFCRGLDRSEIKKSFFWIGYLGTADAELQGARCGVGYLQSRFINIQSPRFIDSAKNSSNNISHSLIVFNQCLGIVNTRCAKRLSHKSGPSRSHGLDAISAHRSVRVPGYIIRVKACLSSYNSHANSEKYCPIRKRNYFASIVVSKIWADRSAVSAYYQVLVTKEYRDVGSRPDAAFSQGIALNTEDKCYTDQEIEKIAGDDPVWSSRDGHQITIGNREFSRQSGCWIEEHSDPSGR